MSVLEALHADVIEYGLTPKVEDWADLREAAKVGHKKSREPILGSTGVTDTWVFVASGFAASYYSHSDGRLTLTRFFEPGHIAGNVSSTWSQDFGSDELIAIGDVDYVELPHSYLFAQYMQSGAIGDYVRMKVVETLRYDKDLLVCQALNAPEARYRFLQSRHPELMDVALKKDVAAFMGVTPQGYSRFLRRRAAI